MSQSSIIETDVLIAGAGPAGCSAALALHGSGMRVALVDKSAFPRIKVCGDSVPAHALIALEPFSPGIYDSFLREVPNVDFRSSVMVMPNGAQFKFSWPLPGYVAERRLFDDFLLQRVAKETGTNLFTGFRIVDYQRVGDKILVPTKTPDGSAGPQFLTRMVIGADGAPSLVSRKLGSQPPEPKRIGHAVRGYFSGVSYLEPGLEYIFYHPRFFPGYFWIFPMQGGMVNAGFGMAEKYRKRMGVPLNVLFEQFREQHPVANRMMAGAWPEGSLGGGMVPFAVKRQQWSGDGWLLTGDAASLVDPISGDGILYAVRSGLQAGLAVRNSRQSDYSKKVEELFWNRMRNQRIVMSLISRMPFIISMAASLGRYSWFRNALMKGIW
jgi:geranylgeranyl reductase family protein